MSSPVPDRTIACSSASWCALRVEAGNTTGRWQDKRAHIVRRLGGCFSWIFSRAAHIATLARNVRLSPKTLHLFDLLHIAGRRHGR